MNKKFICILPLFLMFFCGILFGINGNETVPGIFDGFIILGRPNNN